MSFATIAAASAGRPPVFAGVAKPATPSASVPSSSPFGKLAWGTAAPSVPAPAHISSSTASSGSSNPFARASAQSAASVSVLSSAGAFGNTTASSFGTNTNPFGSAVSPFGRPTAASATGFRGFGQPAAGHAGFASSATGATASCASNGQATTGWFPLGGACSTETESPFGRPRIAPSAQTPLGFFGTSCTTSAPSASSQASPFGPRATAPAATETNPFAAARSGSSEPSSRFSSLWPPRSTAAPLRSTDAGASLLPSQREPAISFTTGAWQTRAALPAATVGSDANNAIGTGTETRESIASSASLGASSALGTGFRFTFTPSWQPKPAAGASQTACTGGFRFPTPLTNGRSSGLGGGATQQPRTLGVGWASRDIDTSASVSAAPSSTPVAAGFDVMLSKAAASAAEPQQSQQQPHLVAQLDVSPYGAGSFGAGRLESAVKAALSFQQACSETANFLSAAPKPKPAPMHTALGLPTRPLHCAALKADRRRVTPARRMSVARGGLQHGRMSRLARLAPSPSREFCFKSSLLRDVAVASKEAKDESDCSSSSEPLSELVAANEESASSEIVESRIAEQRASAASARVGTTAESEDAGERESEPSSANPANPACPVLTASHISTVPEYAQLQRMSSEDLAHVDGFAVCSEEFGEIEWPGLTDVRGLNLDEILLFSEDEVAVYPEECAGRKPEVGSGLNKRAILRLRNIYPSDENRRPGDDSGDVTAAFVERLKKRTADLRAEFLGYEVAGGVWKFQVEHF